MTRSGGEASRLKKGPWTVGEDALLMEHVRRHGEGNWNAVRRETGLQRCGKSCRLRWANHLRPNLRKGPFTPEEELLILRLHALLGNKWARISSHLPGRTDNEIKNYWNTRLKRRQRAGLPLYPPEVERELGQARAHNLNALADAEDNTNANLQPPLLFDAANPLALPPMPPAATAAAAAVAAASASQLLKQNHAFHSQLQEVQQLQFNRANAPPWPRYCQDAGFGLGSYVAPGLPPLPVKVQELPSSQFATDKTSCGGGGPLEPLLHDEQPRHSPGLLRTGSMPELCREHDSKWSQSSECDGDVSSHCPQGEDLDCGGSWDFLLLDDIKPGKRRAASALEEEISYMFGIIPGSIPAEWFSNNDGGSTSPVQSSVITDDDPNLDMQQQQQREVSPLPVSPEEHNWNP